MRASATQEKVSGGLKIRNGLHLQADPIHEKSELFRSWATGEGESG